MAEYAGRPMREEFAAIVSGWTLIDGMEDLTDRIERVGDWMKKNGPLLSSEQATIEMMIQCQIARGIRQGDFEPFIDRDDDPKDWLK